MSTATLPHQTETKPQTATFRAVWPIIDMSDADALIQEARADLSNVAARHRVRITGRGTFGIRRGKFVPGSQGAKFVVVCEAPAVQLPLRGFGGAGIQDGSAA